MRKNYQQVRKQKEQARKVRQQEKEQRRSARLGAAAPAETGTTPEDVAVASPAPIVRDAS
jgi:hypothetical protein